MKVSLLYIIPFCFFDLKHDFSLLNMVALLGWLLTTMVPGS